MILPWLVAAAVLLLIGVLVVGVIVADEDWDD